MNRFTDKQIAQLRKAFSGPHAGQPLDQQQTAVLYDIITRAPYAAVAQLREAGIPHISEVATALLQGRLHRDSSDLLRIAGAA